MDLTYINGQTRLLALLGHPAHHSISPKMHTQAAKLLGLDYVYLAFDIAPDEIGQAVMSLKLMEARGFNLTMPFKRTVIPYLDHLTKAAKLAGAVNTVINDNGILTGDTTDGYGYMESLRQTSFDPTDKVMTILHQKYVDAAMNGGEPLQKFELAPGVIEAEYCKDSGKLCTEACDLDPRGWRREKGYFTRDTVPTDSCQTHVICLRDTSTNLMASDNCNPKDCVKVALIRVEDRSFPTEVYVQDAQFVYREMSKSVQPSGWWGVPYFVHLIKDGEYVGSSYVDTPYNAYCYKHCDYRPWGGNPPAEDSGYTPPGTGTKDTDKPDVDTKDPLDTDDTVDTVDTSDTADTEDTVDTRDTEDVSVDTDDTADTDDTGGNEDTDTPDTDDTGPVEPVESDTDEPVDTDGPDTSDTEPEESDSEDTDTEESETEEDWFV